MIKQIYFGGFTMKNKKLVLCAIILLIILVIGVLVFFINRSKSKENLSNQIMEYTPQEEISDDEIRKTIISLYFKNIETNYLIA